MPTPGNGVHQLKRGSIEAVKVLTGLLSRYPDLLDARWLLNIAYMTLGEYPVGVPEQWRIPDERFRSDYDIKKFTDVAGNNLSGGVIAEDFNNDGDPDLMTSGLGFSDPLRYFVNDRFRRV